MGPNIVCISAVYKPPSKSLEVSDLNMLTSGCDWFIVTGDLNAKHPIWHCIRVNPAGSTLYQHAESNDYSVFAPDSPTYFPNVTGHHPDVLDVALIILPNQTIFTTNINDLSSDHNPVLLQISDSPISVFPPQPTHRINWKKICRNSSSPNHKKHIPSKLPAQHRPVNFPTLNWHPFCGRIKQISDRPQGFLPWPSTSQDHPWNLGENPSAARVAVLPWTGNQMQAKPQNRVRQSHFSNP